MSASSTTTASPPTKRNRTLSSPLIKDTLHFSKFSSETGGAYTFIQATLGPRSGNPLHYHTRFTETFTSTGDLGVVLDVKQSVFAAGESAAVPPGKIHRLFNNTDEPVEFECKLEPGDEGFEKGFAIVYGLSRDGLTDAEGIPKNLVHLGIVCYLMDTWLDGWGFWAATPLLAALKTYGRWSGEEDRLVRKYWD